ncbi:MAG: zinc-binding dehydrogenase [Acidimicrobiales bacterium]
MKAVVIRDTKLHWEDHAEPVAGDTELLVSVRAAGLNGADMAQRRGFYPAPAGSPQDIPGMEMAGEVGAVGAQVTRFGVGDRVMALVGGGAQAELATVDEAHALAVPDDVGWPEAGGFVEVFCTAHDALFTQGGLGSGERLLVTGAAGGVGTAAVQLGVLAGATVVASVRDSERRREVAALGAHEVIDPEAVGAHGPFDVVLELVGAASFGSALDALAVGGRIVVIGIGSGGQVELNLGRVMGGRARISGSTLRGRDRTAKGAVVEAVRRHVVPHLASGRLSVPVCATFPFAEVERAYERFGAGSKLGKVVLTAL